MFPWTGSAMTKRSCTKLLFAMAYSMAALGVALGQDYHHMVNYRGQPQQDLTCMQASSTLASGDVVVYRNDPSTNCFGFPSLQFDTAPVEGGKPNGMTIDWSLMVDELQMQDEDRIHFHLPGFTGGHNTFGIMGSAIDSSVGGNGYTPNFESEAIAGDLTSNEAIRADFGALVGIWGISCGTEKNLYMDRAKVDNLRTAEWDPAREMLKFVLKARRYGGTSGRHDGYTGTRSFEFASAGGQARWTAASASGMPVLATAFSTDPHIDDTIGNSDVPMNAKSITVNDQSLRGSHLQAMEYSFEGPRASILGADLSTLSHDSGIRGSTAALTNMNYKNDGYIYAPGNRVCGIYLDPSKLHRGQVASGDSNGIGPLPPYGGIGKNWYKLAYMRRFAASACSGGTQMGTKFTRPGMLPEICTILRTSQNLASFWQIPFDGDTERVVGYTFTTAHAQLPVASGGAKPAGYVQAPTFSFAQAQGKTTGMGSDNCITVSLIPSVTIMSGSSKSEITIEGLMNSGTLDTDNLPLFSDGACTTALTSLAGSDGAPTRSFQPVAGTANSGLGVPETPAAFSAAGPVAETASDNNILANYRPFGRAALRADGRTRVRTTTTLAEETATNTNGFGSDGFYDDVDWHTRARTGTTSALTTGNPNNNVATASTMQAAQPLASGKIVSPTGTLSAANGLAKFSKADGKLTIAFAPGYYLKAGELLAFSFRLQNSATEQASQALTVSATGTYCDSDDQFCDGVSDPSLAITSVAVSSKGMILETKQPLFVTSTIHQASSDPGDLTTIFVTLATNVNLRRPGPASTSKITIAGLCGFEAGTDVKLYQNQKAGGLPEDGEYPTEAIQTVNDLPGLALDNNDILSSSVTYSGTSITISLGNAGLVAETIYAFAFQLQTVKSANAACKPTISSNGGTETIVQQDMTATNVGYVQAPQFTTLKIGQVTTRPGVTNYLCVTLQHNYEFNSDSVVNQGLGATGNYVESKITISGLTGTQAVSTTGSQTNGYALAYCPTSVPYFDDKTTQHTSTQFQPDVTDIYYARFATFQTTCFGATASEQRCVPGNPFVPLSALDTSVAGRSWFGGQNLDKDSFSWDQATGTAILTVDSDITKERVTEPQTIKGGIPKNSEIVFALPLQNGVANSDCKTVTFESSGKIVQQATMVQTRTGKAIQDGEMMGDACALKVYEPGFLTRQITQSTSSTGDDNVITVSLRTNVDLSSVADGQASYITISGLTGSATGSQDLSIDVSAWKHSPKFEGNTGAWNQAAGSMVLKLDSGACRPPTVWASGFYGSLTATKPFAKGGSASAASATPSTCIKAGFTYSFQFTIVNPDTEQAAPSVSIEGKYRNSDNVEVPIAKKLMQAPISDDADKTAMLVSNQILTTYEIGQLIPAPGSMNVICVTLVASKDIKSEANAPLSSITFTGLTDFDASAQDLQMYYNDGVTKITSVGGDPSTDPYKVGAIFSSQNSASGTTATQTNAGFATSGLGFANYDGKTTGNVVVWIQDETAQSGVYSYVQKNVEHKFCFRLKNPKSEMACKDVSVIVNNKGTISTVKAEQDMFNTIEDYKFGSTCAGYVAPPNFVVKNWRSSSNTTSATAVIHLELATNILLETGDTITVSGLTSYTKPGCTSPPCDVGIDVTRTAVSYVYGKKYVNDKRGVIGFGVSDAAATAAQRWYFANAIQTYDTSGSKDGGKTSTFGTDASWGKLGDTEASASTLTFTIAKDAKMRSGNIAYTINGVRAPSEPVLYEIVFSLQNKATAVSTAPQISINIGQGQTLYVSLPVNHGQAISVSNGVKASAGGLEITYTPMKSIYGGESLILTLPKFARDTNGMLFGAISSPNTAFTTYANWHDWKAYGTAQKYARAFFTNGFVADGYHAKSGDAGQTGERWNYPNVNAKVTTDADYNHDTGVLVLDINDPGVGMNKDYWYAATEDNLYEGRVTRAANDGAAASPNVEFASTPYTSSTTVPGTYAGNAASVDYYLDNGEELQPVRGFAMINEFDADTTTPVTFNSLPRPVAYRPVSGLITDIMSVNLFPAPVPATVAEVADDISGTPPFKSIPAKYQPSRRDNFYKGMLMKCWVGNREDGGRLPYTESVLAGADNYHAEMGNQQELLPPPESVPLSAFGRQAAATNFASIDSLTSANPTPLTGAANQLWATTSTTTIVIIGANTNGYQIGRYYRTGNNEIFKVTGFTAGGSPPQMFVERGQLGTTAAAITANEIALLVPVTEQAALTATQVAQATTYAQAGVSRALETRVIQASFRQIDYVPRKSGGCFVSGASTKKALYASNLASSVDVEASAWSALRHRTEITVDTPSPSGDTTNGRTFVVGQQVILPDGTVRTITKVGEIATGANTETTFVVDGPPMMAARFTANDIIYSVEPSATIAATGCQDEVPGYPAVVRLESPFSRPLDPDTLCYIQRKADVGVYTGMTAMVGNTEYLIKQGAANIYTVGHVATEMKDVNGNPVDRKVPRSYSTESGNLGTDGKRTAGGFFSDGVGLSGQPYTIYSQLELVAKQGSKVVSGETITITVPSSASIMPPSDMSGLVTPVNAEDLISDKVKISHVLLVPLSPACSIVGGYGVSSGCQDGNGKGGVFDLILSDKWPYAYTSENENDINGYAMTVFGGQATVIKTLADKYSQDLPYKPLEGLNTEPAATNDAAFTDDAVLDVWADTLRLNILAGARGGRAQKDTVVNSDAIANTNRIGGRDNANSRIDPTFTVAKELDLLTLTGGSARADQAKMPKLPNSPVTLVHGSCGSSFDDDDWWWQGPLTLPYAVCLSFGELAHSQNLEHADSVTNVFDGPCSLLGACTAFKTDWTLPAVAATTDGNSIPQDITLSMGTTHHVNVGDELLCLNIQNDAAVLYIRVTRLDSWASTNQGLLVQKLWPSAASNALWVNCFKVPNAVVAVLGGAALSFTAPAVQTVLETRHLRPGMNVAIVNPAGYVLRAIARIDRVISSTVVTMTQVFPRGGTAVTPATDDMVVALPDGHAAMDALGVAKNGVQAITGKVGQQQTPVSPHALRDLYSMMGSARPVPNYGTKTGTYENPADNLGLGAYIMVGVYNNGTSDRFVHAQQNNKGSTKSAFPVATDMASNLVVQRYIGTSCTTIPLADVPSGYIGGNVINKPGLTYPKPAGQVPRYQARVAGGYAIGRFAFGVDNIMQVRSDMTSGAPATGTTIPQATILPGTVNMDGAVPMSPSSQSVDLSYDDRLDISTIPLTAALTVTVLEASLDTDVTIAFTTTQAILKAPNYFQIVETGEIIQLTNAAAAANVVAVRGALGSRAMPIPAGATVRQVVAGDATTPDLPSDGFVDFESTSALSGGERPRGVAVDGSAVYSTADVGAFSLVNGKHPSGHSLDVTAPSTMQKIRFGHSTLPLPQVFHTAMHKAGSTAQANLLTRGTCGLSGANAIPNDGIMLMPTSNYSTTTPTTAEVEMCRTVAASQYNTDLPFSRNAYIEQGMDVYLVSSIFDTLIQRPEPMRKTAIGMTEQGRTQNFPGSGFFAGGSTTLFETPVLAAGGVDVTSTAPTVVPVDNGAGAAAVIADNIRIGDIIYFAASATTDHATIMQGEAMLVTAFDMTVGQGQITVQRAYLGTTLDAIADNSVIFVRRSNGAFPGGIDAASATTPLPEVRTVGQGIHSGGDPVDANKRWERNDQLLGNIQTTGTRFSRGGPATGAFATQTAQQRFSATGANARGMSYDSAISSETHNYGFDSDFRLYSVLGPFMRPAIIRDVIDTSKMSRSVLSSRFPGVQTINAYDSPSDLIDTGVRLIAASSSSSGSSSSSLSSSSSSGSSSSSSSGSSSSSSSGSSSSSLSSSISSGSSSSSSSGSSSSSLSSSSSSSVSSSSSSSSHSSSTVASTVSTLVLANDFTVAGLQEESYVLRVGDYITVPTVVTTSALQAKTDAFVSGEIMQVVRVTDTSSISSSSNVEIEVMRGVLGTVPADLPASAKIYKIPFEDRNNNGKYSLAPIAGTTLNFSDRRDKDRRTQYHTYHTEEMDRIISFCNPLQSDLNNAPGSAIMSAITDDALLSNQVGAATQHPLGGGKAVFTNPLLMRGWVSTGTTINAAFTDAVTTLGTAAALSASGVEVGDLIKVQTAAGVERGEIMRVTGVTAAPTVLRGSFGTLVQAMANGDTVWFMKKAEAARLTTQSQSGDNRYASSNGDASKAPSLWTVPRRHHLCRKLVTGAPELATADVVADHYRIANSNNDMYARSRYTESVQMNQVLNQDPSPNMRAMVTFVEPTKIAVSTGYINTLNCPDDGLLTAVPEAGCEYDASSFDPWQVNATCCSHTIKGSTFSFTFPAGFYRWHLALEEIGWYHYDEMYSTNIHVEEYNAMRTKPSFIARSLAEGIRAGYQKLGVNNYRKGLFLGNFIKIDGVSGASDYFKIKQTIIREGSLADPDASWGLGYLHLIPDRRLAGRLAVCLPGFDARLMRVGQPLVSACDCPSACGKYESECMTNQGGTWNTVILLDRVCETRIEACGGLLWFRDAYGALSSWLPDPQSLQTTVDYIGRWSYEIWGSVWYPTRITHRHEDETCRFLNLSNMNITSIDAGAFDAPANFSNITKLDISNNSISRLPAGLFDELGHIQELFMQDNKMVSLPPKIFDKNMRLQRLEFDGNPWQCKVDIPWSVRAYKAAELTHSQSPTMSDSMVEFNTYFTLPPCVSSPSELPSWLARAAAGGRFSHPMCVENRTMADLARGLRENPNLFKSGGLGVRRAPGFDMWVCMPSHPCLPTVDADQGDKMCYVVGEKLVGGARIFSLHVWGINSELGLCT